MEKFGSGIRDKHPGSSTLGYGTDIDYRYQLEILSYSDEKSVIRFIFTGLCCTFY
jgi:hypothetical protein